MDRPVKEQREPRKGFFWQSLRSPDPPGCVCEVWVVLSRCGFVGSYLPIRLADTRMRFVDTHFRYFLVRPAQRVLVLFRDCGTVIVPLSGLDGR
jgi:hypothetical protein